MNRSRVPATLVAHDDAAASGVAGTCYALDGNCAPLSASVAIPSLPSRTLGARTHPATTGSRREGYAEPTQPTTSAA